MAKMIEVRLHGLTCEFAGDDGEELEVTGTFTALTFDDPSVIITRNVIFEFPGGPLRMRKGESVAIDRDVRVTIATPSVDPPGFGELFMKFGGDLEFGGEIILWSQWETLHTNDMINPEPFVWRFYFGKHERIVRADFSVVFVHPL